jgi:hypothetical protein
LGIRRQQKRSGSTATIVLSEPRYVLWFGIPLTHSDERKSREKMGLLYTLLYLRNVVLSSWRTEGVDVLCERFAIAEAYLQSGAWLDRGAIRRNLINPVCAYRNRAA